jgi:hypothetical protein
MLQLTIMLKSYSGLVLMDILEMREFAQGPLIKVISKSYNEPELRDVIGMSEHAHLLLLTAISRSYSELRLRDVGKTKRNALELPKKQLPRDFSTEFYPEDIPNVKA